MARKKKRTRAAQRQKNAVTQKGWFRGLGRIVKDTGRVRLIATALFLVLALLIARYSWQAPVTNIAERGLYDIREWMFEPAVDQDDRIVMVVYNDQTLIQTRKRSPLDRAVLANALEAIDLMEPKSIGIDMLIDQPQDEDADLLAVLKEMQTPTFLGYASTKESEDSIIYEQQKFLDGFFKQLEGTNVSPADVRLELDPVDGVVRSWPPRAADMPPTLAASMLAGNAKSDDSAWKNIRGFANYNGSIRYRRPADEERPVFSYLPIELFSNPDPNVVMAIADQIKGRHVFIGGDIVEVDKFDTPVTAITGKPMNGVEIHANILAQMLDNVAAPRVPGALLWLAAILAVVAAGLTSLLEVRWWKLAIFIGVQVIVFAGLPFWLQSAGFDTAYLPAPGWGVGWGISYAAIAAAARAVGSEQRKFAQQALGKYLPRDIASEIIQDPDRLALHGEKRAIFIVFSDLEGFTKLSHEVSAEMVANLLNRYLDMLSDIVLEHGGTIDKFVGDAVVAFWGAPIGRPDDGFNAARAAWAMHEAGEAFRRTLPPGVPPVGRTRVGLHYGEAVVGNFGGKGRIQYTALGDAMNTAARLESANKSLGSSMLASKEAVEKSELDWWRPLGRVVLRGRATPVDVFEPAPEFSESDMDHLKQILQRVENDTSGAVSDLAQLAARYPDDAALQNLLHRTQANEGKDYVLG